MLDVPKSDQPDARNRVAVQIFTSLLFSGTVLLTYLLARRLALGRWSALAAVAVAADPILLNQSCVVMTETLATLLAALGLYCLVRLGDPPGIVSSLLAGGALALAALCRPTFLPWSPVEFASSSSIWNDFLLFGSPIFSLIAILSPRACSSSLEAFHEGGSAVLRKEASL